MRVEGSDRAESGLTRPAAVNPLPRLRVTADNAAMQSEPTNAFPPKLKRRWFQFSLRDLLALVALAALACAIAFPMIRERQ